MDENSGQLDGTPLLEVVRQLFSRRRSGVLELTDGALKQRFHFVGGELYVGEDHPLARIQAEGEMESSELVSHLAALFSETARGEYRFTIEESSIPECTVVLPTASILMEGAARELDENEALSRLGGQGARWQAVADESARRRGAGLGGEVGALLRRIELPLSVGELLKEHPGDRTDVLRRLCGLEALGLVRKAGTKQIRADGHPGVSRKLVNHFSRRIARQLEQKPLRTPVENHRSQVADLLARVGALDHYELLGVDPAAGTKEIHESFDELARLVHPSHAAALQLEGRVAVLEMLFQRAVAAYVTLTDPDRRSHYDWQMEVGTGTRRSDEEIQKERRTLARTKYREAVHLVANEDYHFAVELLNQAVRLHPSSESLTLLAEIEARNPHWRDRAVKHYREAIDLAPDNPKIRVDLARLLADLDRQAEARRILRETLERFPAHSDAQDLSVLFDRGKEGNKGGGAFSRFFGRRKS